MIKIGITGGIASGKTTASKYFESKGESFVFNADRESKRHLKLSKSLQKKIINIFGNKIVSNNKIDLQLLANKAFSDTVNHKILNGIMWPEIFILINNAYNDVNNKNYKFFVVDAALIFEANFQSFFDKTILITAKKELRIKRAVKRTNFSLESIQNRIALQLSDNKKKKIADYNITNDGSIENFSRKVERLYSNLLK